MCSPKLNFLAVFPLFSFDIYTVIFIHLYIKFVSLATCLKPNITWNIAFPSCGNWKTWMSSRNFTETLFCLVVWKNIQFALCIAQIRTLMAASLRHPPPPLYNCHLSLRNALVKIAWKMYSYTHEWRKSMKGMSTDRHTDKLSHSLLIYWLTL